MESLSRKIKLKIKDKSIDIPLITDFEQLNNEIISILEKEYNQKLPREKTSNVNFSFINYI